MSEENQQVEAFVDTDPKTEQTDPPTEQTSQSAEAPSTTQDTGGEKIKIVSPEGVEVDPAYIEQVTVLATEKGLTQEEAQSIVDAHAEQMGAQIEAAKTMWDEQVDAWRAEAEKDPDLKDFDALAKPVLETYGDEGLAALFESGFGQHPALRRFIARVAKAAAQDTIQGTVNGGVTALTPQEKREKMLADLYPSMTG